MNQEIKNEALEQLNKEILYGFFDKDELFENIQDMFYDEDDLDESWLKTEIEKTFKQHQDNSKAWTHPTDFEKLVRVFDELNKESIVGLHNAGYTRQDAEGDCMDIIDELKAIGINAKGYCYYHSQDLERAIGANGMLFIGYDSADQDNEVAEEVANRIVDLLKANGFNVKWNGSLDTRIEIISIDWKKTPDNIDYNYGRVFEIMEKYNKPKIESKPTKNKPFWKFW